MIESVLVDVAGYPGRQELGLKCVQCLGLRGSLHLKYPSAPIDLYIGLWGKTNFNSVHYLGLYEYVERTCWDLAEADCGIYHIPNGTCYASQMFKQGQSKEGREGVQREQHWV